MSSAQSPKSPRDKGQVLKITWKDIAYIIYSTKTGIRCRLAEPPEGKKNTFIPCPEPIKERLVQKMGYAYVYGEKADPNKPKIPKESKPKVKLISPTKDKQQQQQQQSRVRSPRSPAAASPSNPNKRKRKLKPIKGPTYGPPTLEVVDRPVDPVKYFVMITGNIDNLLNNNKFIKDYTKDGTLMPIFTVSNLEDIRVYNEGIMEQGEEDIIKNKMFENEDFLDSDGNFLFENFKSFIVFKNKKPKKSKMYSQIKSITNRLQKYRYANHVDVKNIKRIKYQNEFIYTTIDV